MMEFFSRLFGRRPKRELPGEVQRARANRDDALRGLDQSHQNLGSAIYEADRVMDRASAAKNGVIARYEAAERNNVARRRRKRP